MTRSFGFEAEFTGHVPELISLLTDAGFAQQHGDRPHQYHCGCNTCQDLQGIAFRAQRDASCGGEVISGIFFDTPEGWERAQCAMQALQDCALDADAGVDMRCGQHVHVGWATPGNPYDEGIPPEDWASSMNLSLAWMALEPLLWDYMVGSVWAARRGFNSLVTTNIIGRLQNNERIWEDQYQIDESRFHELSAGWNERYKAAFMRECDRMLWDRHSDLARASHGGHYEFRIFNASRSAWRTELACRLSVAMSKSTFVDPIASRMEEWLFAPNLVTRSRRLVHLRNGLRRHVVPALRQREQGQRAHWEIIGDLPIHLTAAVEAFREADGRLGDLLDKQIAYQRARKDLPNLSGLIITNDTVVPGHDRVRETLGV